MLMPMQIATPRNTIDRQRITRKERRSCFLIFSCDSLLNANQLRFLNLKSCLLMTPLCFICVGAMVTAPCLGFLLKSSKSLFNIEWSETDISYDYRLHLDAKIISSSPSSSSITPAATTMISTTSNISTTMTPTVTTTILSSAGSTTTTTSTSTTTTTTTTSKFLRESRGTQNTAEYSISIRCVLFVSL